MEDLTRILNALSDGDHSQRSALLETVYQELRSLAAGKMAHERAGHTLQATALVNEAYLRLVDGGHDWKNRRHFFGAASEAMRRVLVENARRRMADKRGSGDENHPYEDGLHALPVPDERVLQIHDVLDRLEEIDERKAKIVKLKYFVGLKHHEIAELLNLNEKTIRREWDEAKLWMFNSIEADQSAE